LTKFVGKVMKPRVKPSLPFGSTQRDTGHGNHPGIHDLKGIQTAEKRRLTAPAGTDDGDKITLLHIEADTLQNLNVAKALAEVADMDNRIFGYEL
jgi:hypothetical protein